MSQAQSVRITTTTTSSSTSTLVLNIGYLKSIPGLLKLLEVVNIRKLIFFVCSQLVKSINSQFYFYFICVRPKTAQRFWESFAPYLLEPISWATLIMHTHLNCSTTWWWWRSLLVRPFCWYHVWYHGAQVALYQERFL